MSYPDTQYFQSTIADLQAAARTLGLQLVVAIASTDSDLETAFATFSQQRVGAVLAYTRAQLAVLAARHALPAIFTIREFVLAGGLMSYGTNRSRVHRLSQSQSRQGQHGLGRRRQHEPHVW
jgi:putative ABC transport system substrate-binding protein